LAAIAPTEPAITSGAHEYVIKPFTADAIRDKLALLGLLPEEALL
jgi:two-component system chemotaxis response regulator CheY